MPICSIVSSLLGICRSTIAKFPFSLNTLTRKRAASPNAKPKSAPPRSRTLWMCSSDVMLRINSSVSSGLSDGPSTRCKIPCTRITGGTPTRMCRSDAPSDTTNCNKSDIEYDIKSSFVAHGGANHFLGRRQAGEDFADAVFAQRPHAHFARAGAQHGGGRLVVNQFARLVINDKNFKDAE